MPRSYRFEPYNVQKHDLSRALLRRDKQKVSGPKSEVGSDKLHYGKQHAQTEELYLAREMAVQLEELAGLESKEGEAERGAGAGTKGMSPPERSAAPIGALPETYEQPHPSAVRELAEQTRMNVRALHTALGDARDAAMRLARTPVELVRLVAREVAEKVRSMPAWS